MVMKYTKDSAIYKVAAANAEDFVKWTQIADMAKEAALMNIRLVYMSHESTLGTPPHSSHTFTVMSMWLFLVPRSCDVNAKGMICVRNFKAL